MNRYIGLYQRRTGVIHVLDNQLQFFCDGELAPVKIIRFANLTIKNVGLNSPTYLLTDRTKAEEGFSTADRSLIQRLAQMGSLEAKAALGGVVKKSNRQYVILGSLVGIGLFFVVVLPFIILNLPLSWLESMVSYEDERRLLSSFRSEEFNVQEKSSETLDRLYQFLREKNPELNEFPAHLAISNMEGANAFTLPGGDIVFTGQLIREAHSVEEIVGVLGHELGHVRKRHILRSSLKGVGVLSGVILLQFLVGQELANLIHMGANIGTLSYSREHEEEADRFSFEILHNAGVSPHGFIDFFKRLSQTESAVDSAFSLLRTHPLSESRKSQIEELMLRYPLQSKPVALPVTLSELQKALPPAKAATPTN